MILKRILNLFCENVIYTVGKGNVISSHRRHKWFRKVCELILTEAGSNMFFIYCVTWNIYVVYCVYIYMLVLIISLFLFYIVSYINNN